MSNDQLIIRGAREHNLKNVDLTVPRDQLVVFTGVSGCGKSSLAFRYDLRRGTATRMWSRSPPMQGSFWGRWKSRM